MLIIHPTPLILNTKWSVLHPPTRVTSDCEDLLVVIEGPILLGRELTGISISTNRDGRQASRILGSIIHPDELPTRWISPRLDEHQISWSPGRTRQFVRQKWLGVSLD